MARGRTSANRRRPAISRGRWLAFALLLVLAGLGTGWWKSRTWTPARNDYPVQGAWISDADGAVDWPLLKNGGADFVYLTASNGTSGRDAAFADSLEQARKLKIQAGAVHVYDPCAPTEGQAGNFVTTVPRDSALLPPAVRLDLDPQACAAAPGDAAMQSELTTFLNQIERHAGKPALLMLSSRFEKRYHMAAVIDRNVWVEGSFLMPGYSGRPWVLWTANRTFRSKAVEGPLQWVVVRP